MSTVARARRASGYVRIMDGAWRAAAEGEGPHNCGEANNLLPRTLIDKIVATSRVRPVLDRIYCFTYFHIGIYLARSSQ